MENIQIRFLQKFIEYAYENGICDETVYISSKEIYGNDKGFWIDFIKGLPDVVNSVETYFDHALLDNQEIDECHSVTEKIRKCLHKRIYADGSRKEFYKELSNFYIKEKNILSLFKNRWNTVDYIWYIAGDKSTDFNYYTKRSLLYAIYNRAMHNYTHSNEYEFEQTSKKIDKDLEKIKKFNKFKHNLKLKNIPFVRQFVK